MATAVSIIAGVLGAASAGYSAYETSQTPKSEPDPLVLPTVATKPKTETTTETVQENAETSGENAVAKEAERRRKAKGYLASIVTGSKGDTSAAPVLKQTLGGM